MQKFITVDPVGREKLRAIFGVSGVTVWQALNYKKDTVLCRKIRKAAMANGGRLMVVLDAAAELPGNMEKIQAFARAL